MVGTLVCPEKEGRHRGVLVVHDVLGFTTHVKNLASSLARLGYVALALDLFADDEEHAGLETQTIAEAVRMSRSARRADEMAALAPDRRERVQRSEQWRERVVARVDEYLPKVAAGLCDLQRRADVLPESVAAVGFSMGGRLVWRLAMENLGLRAGVVFYGQVPPLTLPIPVGSSMLGHYAGNDAPVTGRVPSFAEEFRNAGGTLEYHVYQGAEHGFFNETRPEYDEKAARISWTRSADFLSRELTANHEARVRAARAGGR